MIVSKGTLDLHRRVDTHQLCQGCNYDLFGLHYGGKCPECGAPIRSASRVAGSINDAPIEYLKRLRRGVFSLLASTLAIPLGLAGVLVPATNWGVALLMIAFIASAPWVYGVVVLTGAMPGQPKDREASRARMLALVTRAMTASWFLVLTVPLALRLGAPISGVGLYLAWVLGVVGAGAGFTLLSITVARLAAWANDMDLGHHLRGAAVAVALVCAAFLSLTSLSVFGVHAAILLFFYLAGGLTALGVAAWNALLYLHFAALIAWAPANARTALDRSRIRGDRITQRIVEAQAKPEPIPTFNVVKAPHHGPVIQESHDAAYDLAPQTPLSDVPPTTIGPPNSKPGAPRGQPLPPLPKRTPPPPPHVDRRKDEML